MGEERVDRHNATGLFLSAREIATGVLHPIRVPTRIVVLTQTRIVQPNAHTEHAKDVISFCIFRLSVQLQLHLLLLLLSEPLPMCLESPQILNSQILHLDLFPPLIPVPSFPTLERGD